MTLVEALRVAIVELKQSDYSHVDYVKEAAEVIEQFILWIEPPEHKSDTMGQKEALDWMLREANLKK